MFSYRHVFHAGNHADVLKHSILVHVLKHLTRKDAPLHMIDTHAGAGWYRLDSSHAQKSGEAAGGIGRFGPLESSVLSSGLYGVKPLKPAYRPSSALLADYVALIRELNPDGALVVYPGSPWIGHHLLRQQDKLFLFETHPTDQKILAENFAGLGAGRRVTVIASDGFEGVKSKLPPISRRGLVLIDPSYEIKTDYARVGVAVAESLKRFATGVYAVWYPIIALRESQQLPDQLRRLAAAAGRPWLNATLRVRTPFSPLSPERGLTASGVFIINPPYTLEPALHSVLPELARLLEHGPGADFSLSSADH